MERFNRAVRRHHAKRLKSVRSKYWSWEKKDPRRLGMLLNTPALCSCVMCGNPRKYNDEITRKEIIHKLILKDFLTKE